MKMAKKNSAKYGVSEQTYANGSRFNAVMQ